MDFPLSDLPYEAAFLREFLRNTSLNGSFFNATGDRFLPLGIQVTIVVVYLIVCVVGLVGNCAVMYVIVR